MLIAFRYSQCIEVGKEKLKIKIYHWCILIITTQIRIYRVMWVLCLLVLDKSIQFSCSVISNSLRPHGMQHTRHPCSSPTPGACSNSHPSCWWCHVIISSSVIFFSSCLQSFPASGSYPISQFFASGGQSIGVSASASVFTMNVEG